MQLTPAIFLAHSFYLLGVGAAFIWLHAFLRAGFSICTTGHPERNFACNNYGQPSGNQAGRISVIGFKDAGRQRLKTLSAASVLMLIRLVIDFDFNSAVFRTASGCIITVDGAAFTIANCFQSFRGNNIIF